jgi:broad specificity phosphatase PhoE
MGRLVVVRHGQASLLSADYDVLSNRGKRQAELLGRHWAALGLDVDAVYSGPAKRQLGTAQIVAEQIEAAGRSWTEVEEIAELDEHDAFAMVGKAVPALQGDADIAPLQRGVAEARGRAEKSAAFQRLFEAVMVRWLDGSLDLEGIETWPAFADRVERGVRRMIADGGSGRTVAAFTSVGPTAVMLRLALGTADRRSFETAWRLRNASITTFMFSGGRFTLDGFNALPHLPDAQDWTFR